MEQQQWSEIYDKLFTYLLVCNSLDVLLIFSVLYPFLDVDDERWARQDYTMAMRLSLMASNPCKLRIDGCNPKGMYVRYDKLFKLHSFFFDYII